MPLPEQGLSLLVGEQSAFPPVTGSRNSRPFDIPQPPRLTSSRWTWQGICSGACLSLAAQVLISLAVNEQFSRRPADPFEVKEDMV